MRPLILLVLILISCTRSIPEQTGNADSIQLEDQNFDMLKDPKPYTIKQELRDQTLTVMGQEKKLSDLLKKLYVPDTFTAADVEDQVNPPQYIITGVQMLQGKFFSSERVCEDRSLFLCTRGDYVEEEYYDMFFLALDTNGEVVVSDKLLFEGSQGQSSTDLMVSKIQLSVNKDCALLMVRSESEGGDVNLSREEWIEIFIAGGKGFRSLFRLQLEETYIQDFEASQDEQQDSSSKIQQYEILDSSSNGLFDIKVIYTHHENGKLIVQGEKVYTFDGQYYIHN